MRSRIDGEENAASASRSAALFDGSSGEYTRLVRRQPERLGEQSFLPGLLASLNEAQRRTSP